MLTIQKKIIEVEINAASDAETQIIKQQLQEFLTKLKREKVIGLLRLRSLLTDNVIVAAQINKASKGFLTKEYGGE